MTLLSAGFYGKIPTAGDFVRRRLPSSFVAPWDKWLRKGLAMSRDQLAEDWLNRFLNMHIWRFALDCNVCDDNAWLGILIPSVDRAGRYYPLTFACLVPETILVHETKIQTLSWFDHLEDLAYSVLESTISVEDLDTELRRIGIPDFISHEIINARQQSESAIKVGITSLLDFSIQSPLNPYRAKNQRSSLNNPSPLHRSAWWVNASISERPWPKEFIGMLPPNEFYTLLAENFP